MAAIPFSQIAARYGITQSAGAHEHTDPSVVVPSPVPSPPAPAAPAASPVPSPVPVAVPMHTSSDVVPTTLVLKPVPEAAVPQATTPAAIAAQQSLLSQQIAARYGITQSAGQTTSPRSAKTAVPMHTEH